MLFWAKKFGGKNLAGKVMAGKLWRESLGGKVLAGIFWRETDIYQFLFYYRPKRLGYGDASPGADVMKTFNYLSLTLLMNLQVLDLESFFTVSSLCR